MQPAGPPQLHGFLSVLWDQQQPGGEELDLTLPAHVYIGSGHYPPREPDDPVELVYEIRVVGMRPGIGYDRRPEQVDSTLMFPSTQTDVMRDYYRWCRWIRMFSSATAIDLPTLLPQPRLALLDIARFLRALATPGTHGIGINEWQQFWQAFTLGFPPREHLWRGEAHIIHISHWLRLHYPHVFQNV